MIDHDCKDRIGIGLASAQRETIQLAGLALVGNKSKAIYLGCGNGDDLIYAGKFDYGLDRSSGAKLRGRLMPLILKIRPDDKTIAYKDVWVEPHQPAAIGYQAKSAGDKVRHSFYRDRAGGSLKENQTWITTRSSSACCSPFASAMQ
jgi:ATP-dependent DNA ligase